VAAAPVTIEQLARDTVHIADPETALRALSALRQELDMVEQQLVKRALAAGASWSDIARSLGVSKQAAHRKHRHLAEQRGWTVGTEPKILVTAEARRSIQLAREEAERLGQPAVGTEHILLGILRCRQSHAVKALNTLGVTHERASQCLHTTMPGVSEDSSENGGGDADHLNGVSPHGRRILEGSLREALTRGDGYIGVEHLLLALLTDSRNGAVQTLEDLKTTPAQVRRELERQWRAISGVDQPVAEQPVATTAD
jgi:ATP-dependent Clp protease ATP-binding subunit ClpA